ncbi:glycosyltransferase [Pedobacter sp. 22163]|uniref:glycosyltransferase n=1 Tax=Pedobacter sp. 22163 TaxID=3453883 RepID=UPI003F854023
MKKITFITTAQPTTNPRLVKEAEYLKSLGFEVKAIVCFYERWADQFDLDIISKNPGMYIFCGGSPFGNILEKLTYYKTRLRQKVWKEIFRLTKNGRFAENAISRAHAESLRAAKSTNADLFIAHNLGALPAAAIAATFCAAKVGYDAEDMDSGQYLSRNDYMYLLNLLIEQKYFSKTEYFTAASPLIANNYKKKYSFLKPVVINNVFPKTKLLPIQNTAKGTLKLFWFSQTVGTHRGIEEVIRAMSDIKKPVELHLLGDYDEETRSLFTKIATDENLTPKQIIFYRPIPAKDIFKFAAGFDLGLATEIGTPLNRDICLTNKIFTYIQCGLPIIASNTSAQTMFINEYPKSGKVYIRGDRQSLSNAINHYIDSPELLINTKKYNYNLGQDALNWETESKKFIEVINKTLIF